MPSTGLEETIALLSGFNDEEADMYEKQQAVHAEVGGVIVIRGHHLGEPERMGEILEVSGGPTHLRCRVRWDDEHESTLSLGSDAIIRRARGHRDS